ncbi:MAG: hypothetical protein VKJ02_06995 [Snowella sp.]|nr:hypothetical protein [Snowella sp.]
MTALMNSNPTNQAQTHSSPEKTHDSDQEPILCPHCLRTASNGIKCRGICVADSDY